MTTINIISKEEMKNEVSRQINLEMHLVIKQIQNFRDRIQKLEDEISIVYAKLNLLNMIELPETRIEGEKTLPDFGIMPLKEEKYEN